MYCIYDFTNIGADLNIILKSYWYLLRKQRNKRENYVVKNKTPLIQDKVYDAGKEYSSILQNI